MPHLKRPAKRVALLVESSVAPRRRMLSGVARYVHEHEPWSIYLKPFGVEKSLASWLRSWDGDGVIAAMWDPESELVDLPKMPIVDVVGVLHRSNVPLVHTDDRAVGLIGAEHLLDCGFRNLGFVEYRDRGWSMARRAGFVEAVAARGFQCHTHALSWPSAGLGGPENWERQQSLLADWIRSLPKPAGVMTSTDLMGQQFLEACLRAQVAVPEEVAVIGADNDDEICAICSVPLSTVIINDHQRGYEAAALLDRLMAGEPPPSKPIYIPPSGVATRGSTDVLALEDELLVRALRFVREHACESIVVEDVVKCVPLSRPVLERRFRRTLGRSINAEIVRVRLNRAVELLCHTQLEIKAIAQRVGFGSTSYMHAVFRNKIGRTPGSYRWCESDHSTANVSRTQTPLRQPSVTENGIR